MENNIRKHAEELHEKCAVIDAHFDLLMDVEDQRRHKRKDVIRQDYLKSLKKGKMNLIVSSLFIDNKFIPEMSLRNALDQISAFHYELDNLKDELAFCKSYDDIIRAKNEGKIGIMLSFEGVEPIYNDLSLLRVFYELGVRGVGLVWSRRNFAGDGCHFSSTNEGKRGGLTDFGVAVVKEAERLGMIIDVSHLNDEGFYDVMKFAKGPVIASHSNCRELAGSMRNLTDDQIKCIASKGGVIGMNGTNGFVSDDKKDQDAEHLAFHVDHIVKVAGIDYVGLGFDFCDMLTMRESPEERKFETFSTFDVVKGHGDIPRFTECLIKHGYTDGDIEKILGGNFLRVYKEVLK